MTKKIEIGNKARCIVSGFEGIVISRVEYLNGCIQLALKPKVDKDGKEQDAIYFDEGQLEFVDDGIAVAKRGTGGPSRDAPRGFGFAK